MGKMKSRFNPGLIENDAYLNTTLVLYAQSEPNSNTIVHVSLWTKQSDTNRNSQDLREILSITAGTNPEVDFN